MKLSRLLWTLALIAGAALAAPAPAWAGIQLGEPLSPAEVQNICTTLGGGYTYDDRGAVCQLGAETRIVCADSCAYQLDGRAAPPMQEACAYAGGLLAVGAGYLYTCQTRDVVFLVDCPDRLVPHMVCVFASHALSDQPMS